MGPAGSVKQWGGMLSLLSSSVGSFCSNQLAILGTWWGPGAQGWSGALLLVDLQLWGQPPTSSNPGPAPPCPSGAVCTDTWDSEGIYTGHRYQLFVLVFPQSTSSWSHFFSYRMSIGTLYLANVIG